MQVPPELSFRGIESDPGIESRIRERLKNLEKVCDYISSAHIAVEKTQQHQERGNPYRVRIDLNVPPGHEIAVRKEPSKGDLHHPLESVINDAFDAARKQLKELVEKQQGKTKSHPAQEVNAFVDKIFHQRGYGFLKSLEGHQVYFHRNSVLNETFDRLRPGAGVHYTEEMGEKGPQASSVRIIEMPNQ